MVEAVEKHIKYLYKKDMEVQLDYLDTDLYNVRVHNECIEEVYGFTYALRCLGLETQRGYCNTSKVRENFSWWRNLLELEAKWDLWVERGIAYEPWVKNKKSTYS